MKVLFDYTFPNGTPPQGKNILIILFSCLSWSSRLFGVAELAMAFILFKNIPKVSAISDRSAYFSQPNHALTPLSNTHPEFKETCHTWP